MVPTLMKQTNGKKANSFPSNSDNNLLIVPKTIYNTFTLYGSAHIVIYTIVMNRDHSCNTPILPTK